MYILAPNQAEIAERREVLAMKRLSYIIHRFFEMLVSIISRTFNALVLGGSTHQTTSARMYIENWPRGQKIINAVFFWEEDHCRRAWDLEVYHARRTLEMARES